MHFLRFRRR